MEQLKSLEGKSAFLYTKEDSVGMKVRILRFMEAYVEVENNAGKARLYPRENIAFFQFCG